MVVTPVTCAIVQIEMNGLRVVMGRSDVITCALCWQVVARVAAFDFAFAADCLCMRKLNLK